MKKYRILLVQIMLGIVCSLVGCNQSDDYIFKAYQEIKGIDKDKKFRFAESSYATLKNEKKLLEYAKKEIYCDDYNSHHTAICVLFAIVGPDEMDPPKCFLVDDLQDRFQELYDIYKMDDEVGVLVEKFLYSCFGVDLP